MQRLFLNLAVVLLGYLVIPANLTAGDAEDGAECGLIFFGSVCVDKGEYDEAIADFNRVLAIDLEYPQLCDNPQLYNILAWFYANCPDAKFRDGKKAVENASKAYQLGGGKNWSIVGTVAAAYAEKGDFKKALEWQAKAIELAATDKSVKDEDKAKARSRLELYKQNKPYREELKRK